MRVVGLEARAVGMGEEEGQRGAMDVTGEGAEKTILLMNECTLGSS